ncbi:Pathogenic type III effector avirulence factor Avr cleavage site-containing protein [Artemisia annua]|uniref:Pathogenic type III effector avirulence factor Avr cleavage site-containing protein n=1 Tax=Artemisia annua TaxID=35608 RepID=A0A2U1Q045_ARTAN|nr:Pathogenic type III effector avirulence factor Avr cleavage site-containing protein [Artemisia annua]
MSQQQRSHIPKFGSWDADNVPYTTYFENARKDKGSGLMINPNDPEQNPEAFMAYGGGSDDVSNDNVVIDEKIMKHENKKSTTSTYSNNKGSNSDFSNMQQNYMSDRRKSSNSIERISNFSPPSPSPGPNRPRYGYNRADDIAFPLLIYINQKPIRCCFDWGLGCGFSGSKRTDSFIWCKTVECVACLLSRWNRSLGTGLIGKMTEDSKGGCDLVFLTGGKGSRNKFWRRFSAGVVAVGFAVLDQLVRDKGRPTYVREKRTERIRQNRWFWIQFVWRVKENSKRWCDLVFLVGGGASLNKGSMERASIVTGMGQWLGSCLTESRGNSLVLTKYLGYSHRSTSVPMFGAWDEKDPKSGEGFTVIFQKVKEEKHIAATKFPPIPQQPSYNSNIPQNDTTSTKKMDDLNDNMITDLTGGDPGVSMYKVVQTPWHYKQKDLWGQGIFL